MPDIAMCNNALCPLAKTCYRYNAIPDSLGQTYGMFEPDEDGESCDYYYPLQKGHKITANLKTDTDV